MMTYKELQELKELVDEGNSTLANLLAHVQTMSEAATYVGVFEQALASVRKLITRAREPFHQAEIRINTELEKAPDFRIKNVTSSDHLQIFGSGKWLEPDETTTIPWCYRYLDYYKDLIDDKKHLLIISEEEQNEPSQ